MAATTQHDDLELAYKDYEPVESEQDTLLSTRSQVPIPEKCCSKSRTKKLRQYGTPVASFVAGVISILVLQNLLSWGCSSSSVTISNSPSPRPVSPPKFDEHIAFAPPYIGSTEIHQYPPSSPTNAIPSLFPTKVGYPGPTGTGAEPAIIATAPIYPIQSSPANLVPPLALADAKGKSGFDIFKSWGNLSPWFSVEKGAFGLDSGPETPEKCEVKAAHILHRHGARYPTKWSAYASPAWFATKLHEANDHTKIKFTGDLSFLNKWTYKLGNDVLTPFGRQQLFDLGVSYRLKYGYLLEDFTDRLPVFRTESQDRMLASATNFALGFFGWPLEDKFLLSVTVEANNVNNTLAPYKTCPNGLITERGDRGIWYLKQWNSVYLKDALDRFGPLAENFTLTIEDIYTFQVLCAYETVSLGYSQFCELFTQEEWEGFEYALDLYFYYGSAFGSPVTRALGMGYVQELVARLTQTPITEHRSSTNSTLDDDPITFPLDQKLYVDATHEVTVLYVLTALNLTVLGEGGPLPATHIIKDRKFVMSKIAPFATNVQFQVLSCSESDEPQIRIILNDAPVALTGIEGCPEHADGLCPLDTFVKAQQKLLAKTDWDWSCFGEWSVPEGPAWETTTGDPPTKENPIIH